MANALIVDDDASFAPALAELIRGEGFDVTISSTVADAHARIYERAPDVVFLDLVLPDGNGIDLAHQIDALALDTHVVVITGHAEVESTIAALRAGVADFLTKPLDLEQLRNQLRMIRQDLPDPGHADDAAPPHRDGLGDLLGASEAMQGVYRMINRVARTDMTVLLYGESGTGKELAARAVHEHSARSEQPFLALNCGAVPSQLIANELFGHERGSFTDANTQHLGYFERADGGTLFLDEVTEMPLDLQVQLLRVLENRTVTRIGGTAETPIDVRVIAATNRHPREAVAQGRLREDLLFRLMAFPIPLPALRARLGDVALLAERFLAELNRESDDNKRFAPECLEVIQRHAWPGNVRELRNAVRHAFILATDVIEETHFPAGLGDATIEEGTELRCAPGTPIEDFERRFILATLAHHDGNKRLTAETLGISLKTLYNRLNEYRSV